MTEALIGLGSNLGEPQENLSRAIELLRAAQGVESVVVSSSLSTLPIGGPPGQGPFLNAAALVKTSLTPSELLDLLQNIEAQLRRVREVRWGPRTIDLDLLLYGDAIIDTPRLTVPHPRLAVRKFALAPAAEIAGDLRHPQIGWTIRELHNHLLHASPYFAITSDNRTLAAQIARDAAAATGARIVERPRVEVAAAPGERLEFLTQAAAQLPPAAATGHDAVISDFWIGEALAGATSGERSQFSEIAGRVAAPKLLAIIGGEKNQLEFRGPTLSLPAERAAAAQELIAAIEAMQP